MAYLDTVEAGGRQFFCVQFSSSAEQDVCLQALSPPGFLDFCAQTRDVKRRREFQFRVNPEVHTILKIVEREPGDPLVAALRAAIFMMGKKPGLAYDELLTPNPEHFLLLCYGHCPGCNTPMIGYEFVWGLCHQCARSCAHEYTLDEHVIRSPTADKRKDRICAKCGRAGSVQDGGFAAVADKFVYEFSTMLAKKAEATGKLPEVVLLTDENEKK